jgi:hypothetical protein
MASVILVIRFNLALGFTCFRWNGRTACPGRRPRLERLSSRFNRKWKAHYFAHGQLIHRAGGYQQGDKLKCVCK